MKKRPGFAFPSLFVQLLRTTQCYLSRRNRDHGVEMRPSMVVLLDLREIILDKLNTCQMSRREEVLKLRSCGCHSAVAMLELVGMKDAENEDIRRARMMCVYTISNAQGCQANIWMPSLGTAAATRSVITTMVSRLLFY